MHVEILPATPQHRSVLRHLYELYCHDFSEMTGEDVTEAGTYTGDEFLADWSETGWRPFLVKVDGQWAGFAWVVTGRSYVTPGADHLWMEEFFVMRKYRRRGIGERVAAHLFDRFPGTWEVGEIASNVSAQAFWRKVIGRYTHDRFQEIGPPAGDNWHGPIQVFTSLPRPGAERP